MTLNPWKKINDLKSTCGVMAWLVRASFEVGYRSAKPDTTTVEWKSAWKKSMPRTELVKMGYIQEGDTFR